MIAQEDNNGPVNDREITAVWRCGVVVWVIIGQKPTQRTANNNSNHKGFATACLMRKGWKPKHVPRPDVGP